MTARRITYRRLRPALWREMILLAGVVLLCALFAALGWGQLTQ